jgi:hypothetical protein
LYTFVLYFTYININKLFLNYLCKCTNKFTSIKWIDRRVRQKIYKLIVNKEKRKKKKEARRKKKEERIKECFEFIFKFMVLNDVIYITE